MRQQSQKMIDRAPARARAVAAVIARDGGCQWPVLLSSHLQEFPDEAVIFEKIGPCSGPLTMHEPYGSVNVDNTDPDNGICACWYHNGIGESHTHLALRVGFVKKGSGLPIRKKNLR